MNGQNAGGFTAVPGVPQPSVQGTLLEIADARRRDALRLQADARKLEVFNRSLPGMMPERAADKLCEIFGLDSSRSITAAFEARVARLRDEAIAAHAEADDFELLAKSLPTLMHPDAQAVIRDALFV